MIRTVTDEGPAFQSPSKLQKSPPFSFAAADIDKKITQCILENQTKREEELTRKNNQYCDFKFLEAEVKINALQKKLDNERKGNLFV